MQVPQMFQGDSLVRLAQGAAVGAALTAIVGFNWGGWMLGSTAQTQIKNAEQASIVRVLAPICADRFTRSADAAANLKALNGADSWKRYELIEKAGLTTFPGSEPDRAVANACATLLTQVK
jgi:alpha/beta superfamily hydrolase